MGFLDALRGWAGLAGGRDVDPRRLVDSDVGDGGGSAHPEFPRGVPAADPEAMAAPPETTAFDREQWRKKLKKILEHLPAAEDQWNDLQQEAGALNFETDWISRTYREEFALMTRRVVSDSVVTPEEHRNLDLARSLMGIPDAEAVAKLHEIVAEAETFFGKTVEGA